MSQGNTEEAFEAAREEVERAHEQSVAETKAQVKKAKSEALKKLKS